MKLNLENFEKLFTENPQMTKTKLCEMMSINRSTLYKAMNGRPISTKFISGFKQAFPKKDIKKYFDFDN